MVNKKVRYSHEPRTPKKREKTQHDYVDNTAEHEK